jgi:uncharacterized protein YjiS (DUF1127 family)
MLSNLIATLRDRLDKRRRYRRALAELDDAKYVHQLVRDLGVDVAQARLAARRRIYGAAAGRQAFGDSDVLEKMALCHPRESGGPGGTRERRRLKAVAALDDCFGGHDSA